MNIEVDWDRVIDVEPKIEEDSIYTISFSFDDGTVCTYAYSNSKMFVKDYTNLIEREVKNA